MKTTEQDFEDFKAACEKWRYALGLINWRFYYRWCPLKKSQAETEMDFEARHLMIALNKGEVTETIAQLAKHEVIEGALLGVLRKMALEQNARTEDVITEAHRITQTLVEVLK